MSGTGQVVGLTTDHTPITTRLDTDSNATRIRRRNLRERLGVKGNTMRGRGDTPVPLDKRYHAARHLARFRESLVEHVGGKPSAVENALINLCEQLQLRLLVFDAEFAEIGVMAEYDTRQYLAWANSLSRALTKLGIKGKAATGPRLADLLDGPKTKPQGRQRHRLAADGGGTADRPRPARLEARWERPDEDDEG